MGTPGTPIRVLAVDDHSLMRAGIAAVISRAPDMVIVGEAADGAEACEQFRILRPDVTLMDLQMPRMNGIEAIQIIRQQFPDALIIVLTTYKTDAQAMRALRAGAQGFLLKNMLRKDLVDLVRNVVDGRRVINPEVAAEIADHSTEDPLTEREIEVLALVAEGNSNREVGVLLSIGDETVKGHMRNISAKLGARDRTHAVAIAIRRGIIEP
ncbi:response regulator transcription factor [Luteibacter pinisoli]|uniref:Response regulator transcription factor n=1 Tax=Luteibacter pinisoli TaxID=2589080 RepID=A0A4Y5Z4I9_9GAMM|nr:response regulator transcription factor [Luteibacter pinisoli]QDE39846.1 response regulator transcription factor [Luteibacter pinisoli]